MGRADHFKLSQVLPTTLIPPPTYSTSYRNKSSGIIQERVSKSAREDGKLFREDKLCLKGCEFQEAKWDTAGEGQKEQNQENTKHSMCEEAHVMRVGQQFWVHELLPFYLQPMADLTDQLKHV